MTNLVFRIRPVLSSDLFKLARLHQEVFQWEAWNERAIADVMAMPAAGGLVAALPPQKDLPAAPRMPVETEAVVGFALYTLVAEDAELLTLAVRRDVRRRGIGSALMNGFIAVAVAAGARQALLEVAADNPVAQQFYCRAGFKSERTRNNYYQRPGNRQVSAHLLRLPFSSALHQS